MLSKQRWLLPFNTMALFARRSVAAPVRSFSTSQVARKDLIQDLYLNQLRSYKPAAKAADAHLSSVKSYAAPAAPQAPTLPSDLTAELSKFDATEPVLASSTSSTTAAAATSEDEGVAGGAKEFLEFLEKDTPKADAHH
ncbi:hypothetical protein QFC19_006704 [Naganishia cerealis]|uniref:Uncharacterized protein n=1 Tax=Naganishia cerealis TaxID=610337 RepID=A0ACC2VF30_9TREE|nr:hypothetical protein QFC19_006704 [Naganishia cerealis]